MIAPGIMIGDAMEYFAGWLIFPFAAYSLAKGRNRNANLWFCIGILLGPIAVLVLAMMKPVPGAETDYH